jgi:hypothetical protein
MKQGQLLCKRPSGHAAQNAHYRQGELDGACGVYSIAMVLNILGVFESDNLGSDVKLDRRTSEWKLIKSLNEYGLYRKGLTSEQIEQILNDNYAKYVMTQVFTKQNGTDLIEATKLAVDKNVPIILGISYNQTNGHWIVVVGYATDENDNLTALLTLDPGTDAPRCCLWNGIIDLPKQPRKKFGYSYNSAKLDMVDIDEAIIIMRR